VPKLLSPEQKQARVELSDDFLKLLRWRSAALLQNIITTDESSILFHTPQTKRQSKQWTKKGQPGSIKAKVHASRTKQMVLVFFDAASVIIFMNYVPRGETVNVEYIKKALARFLVIFRQKRPNISSQEWFLYWNNAPVHTAATVQEFLAAKGVKTIPHPPFSPELAPADYFLFPRIKTELAGRTLIANTFKNNWEGVVRTIKKEEFAVALSYFE